MKNSLSVILLLTGLFLVWSQWDCLRVHLGGEPVFLREHLEDEAYSHVVFLFGKLCTTCPSGLVLEELKDRNTLLIFEKEISRHEIQTFMDTFRLMGRPLIDDGSIESYLIRIHRCRDGEGSWRQNALADVVERSSLANFRLF